MEKDILEQYAQVTEEIEILNARIIKQETRLARIRRGGTVKDKVQAGDIKTGHMTIEGYPSELERFICKNIEKNCFILETRKLKLIQMQNDVEEYISSIEDSKVRIALQYRYIDGLTWEQAASRMPGFHTATEIRLAYFRYLEKERNKKKQTDTNR